LPRIEVSSKSNRQVGYLAIAVHKRTGFDTHSIQHRNEQIGQWYIFVEFHVSTVLEPQRSSARENERVIFVFVGVAVAATIKNDRSVEQRGIPFPCPRKAIEEVGKLLRHKLIPPA
jgi:hypothetical protein